VNNHLSRLIVANKLKRPFPDAAGNCIVSSIRSCSRWGLHSQSGHPDAGELLPHLSTLTLWTL